MLQRPWSNIALVFVTDLPMSKENTVIMVIIVSVPVHALIELIFNHILCYYGNPKAIVSDRGIQFVSHI